MGRPNPCAGHQGQAPHQGVTMKKRDQKLSLHRETVLQLDEILSREKLDRAVGGEMTSCMPKCPIEPFPSLV